MRDALPPRLLGLIDNWQVIGSQFPATLEITWNANTQLMISLTPLPDKTGGRGWVMALRDITALKQQEKVKTQALAEVVGRIRLLLAEAMNALVEINLRAPQDERITASLFRLTRVWENIQTWGDELLSVAQADSARAPNPATVDLATMLKKLPEDAAVRRYQLGGGLFEVQIDNQLPAVQTDPELISAALFSLVRRAILRGPANNEIQVSARMHHHQVWVEISDNGPPAEDTSPLRGVDQSINRLVNDPVNTSAAVGLELVRARTILDRLEGQLWIGGRGPRGSTIQFCLPTSLSLAGAQD
jgi:K+-sensing histidine kinase KdpD